jgi:hypothetical protein
VENGLVFAGNHVGQSDRIQPVAEVMADLVGA